MSPKRRAATRNTCWAASSASLAERPKRRSRRQTKRNSRSTSSETALLRTPDEDGTAGWPETGGSFSVPPWGLRRVAEPSSRTTFKCIPAAQAGRSLETEGHAERDPRAERRHGKNRLLGV